MLRKGPITSWNRKGGKPLVSDKAYVDETAVLIGEVIVGEDVYIAPNVVLRADEGAPIVVKEGSNLQDGVIVHALKGSKVVVGPLCSVAHGVILHGPVELVENVFVGFRAVLFKTKIGRGCFIGHNATVIGVNIPDERSLADGTLVKAGTELISFPRVSVDQEEFKKEVLLVNQELCWGYLNQP